MNNYITTNIRISEKEYLRLKSEAAKRRKSLAAVIREKISVGVPQEKSKTKVESILKELDKIAKENSKYTKGLDGTKIIRELRDHAKW